MEYNSSSMNPPMERPITRSKRERDSSIERPQSYVNRPPSGLGRPQSKLERPLSRRGIKTESWDFKAMRPPTSGRMSARPPTANILANRIPTANFAQESGIRPGSSYGGSQNFSQHNHLVLDQPMSHHNMMGMRPGTARGVAPMSRILSSRIDNRRFPENSLQFKIRELNQEIMSMKQELDYQNKEQDVVLEYEQRLKELTSELQDYQERLSSYDSALQRMTEDVVREAIEHELKDLKDELESTEDRQELQRKITENVAENMSPEVKQRYDNLCSKKFEAQKRIEELQDEYNELVSEKDKLEKQMVDSPLKKEDSKLQVRIAEAEAKRDKLVEKEKNLITPDREKQDLLKKMKRIQTELTTLEEKASKQEKQVFEKENQLKNLDSIINKNSTKKTLKFNKLQSAQGNQSMLKKLEEDVILNLEKIANVLDLEGQEKVLSNDEITTFQILLREYSNEGLDSNKSLDKLKQDGAKIQAIATKLSSISSEAKKTLKDLNFSQDFDSHEQLDEKKLKELAAKQKDLTREASILKSDLEDTQRKIRNLRNDVERSGAYLVVLKMRDKLYKVKYDASMLEDAPILDKLEHMDFSELKNEVLTLVGRYNKILIEELKTNY